MKKVVLADKDHLEMKIETHDYQYEVMQYIYLKDGLKWHSDDEFSVPKKIFSFYDLVKKSDTFEEFLTLLNGNLWVLFVWY